MKNEKQIILLIGFIFLFQCSLCIAQTENTFDYYNKSKKLTGISFSGAYGGKSLVGSTNLRFGYFLMDKFILGGDGEYNFNGEYNRDFFIGPYFRYYFLKKKLSPIIEINYQYELIRFKDNGIYQYGSSNKIAGDVGLAIVIFKKLGLEIIGEHILNNNLNKFLNPIVRINYHF